MERSDPFIGWHRKRDPRSRIQSYEINLGSNISEEASHAPGVGIGIVDSAEEHVFERNVFSRSEGKGPANLDKIS